MRKILIGIALLLPVTGLAAFEEVGLNRITFVNSTEYDMHHIFFSPSDSEYWGVDILGGTRILSSGEELSFFVSYPDECASFDFMAIDEDMDAYSSIGFELCDGSPQSFEIAMHHFQGNMGEPAFSMLELENDLETEIYFLFVSPSDSQIWGIDVLDIDTVFAPGETVVIPAILGGDGRFDVMAVDARMDSYSFTVELGEPRGYLFLIESTDKIDTGSAE